MGGFLRRHKRVVPYLLLAPGLLWLVVFYVVPGFQMFLTSLWSGTLETGYEFALSNVSNYTEALTRYWPQFSRSLLYGAAATLLTFAISYPARLHDRVPWRPLQEPAAVPRRGAVLHELPAADHQLEDHPRRHGDPPRPAQGGRASCRMSSGSWPPRSRSSPGITYNFLPFMTLPIYVSLEKIDKRLVEAAEDLFATRLRRVPADHLPAVAAGRLRRLAADVHPGDGRLRQRASCSAIPQTTMIGNVIQNQFLTAEQLPDRVGA